MGGPTLGQRLAGYLAMAGAMAIVGSSVVAGKILTSTAPVFLASALRFALASAILVPLHLASSARDGRRLWPEGRDLAYLFLQALTGVFGFNVALLYGLKFTSASAGGIITSMTPAAVVLLSMVALGERPHPRRLAGAGLALVGLMVMNLAQPASGPAGSRPLLGNLLVLGAVVGEALFTVLAKAVSDRVSPLGIATWVSVFGLTLFLAPGLYELAGYPLSRMTPETWALIGYYAVFVTVVAFYLWYFGLARTPATAAGVFTAVMPVSAVALSAAILAEPVEHAHLVAAGLVLAAIGLTSVEPAPGPGPARALTDETGGG